MNRPRECYCYQGGECCVSNCRVKDVRRGLTRRQLRLAIVREAEGDVLHLVCTECEQDFFGAHPAVYYLSRPFDEYAPTERTLRDEATELRVTAGLLERALTRPSRFFVMARTAALHALRAVATRLEVRR